MESLAVLDVHIAARWKHDTKTGHEIAGLDGEYLVHYRGSSPKALMNNALIRAKGYTQRWMAETSYSTTKRSHGVAERALGWCRQFRETVLMFAIINIEPLCEPLELRPSIYSTEHNKAVDSNYYRV